MLLFVTNSQDEIKNLLLRHVTEIDPHVSFLVETLNIPNDWIEEAKALEAENSFNFMEAIEHYLNCKNFYRAHSIFMEFAAPNCIISYEDIDTLYTHLYENIISKLQNRSNEFASWSLSGEIYCKYLKIAERMKNPIEAFSYSDIIEQIVRIDELVRTLTELPSSNFYQRVSISIMENNLGEWSLRLHKGLLKVENGDLNFPEKFNFRFLQRGWSIRQAEGLAELHLRNETRKIR